MGVSKGLVVRSIAIHVSFHRFHCKGAYGWGTLQLVKILSAYSISARLNARFAYAAWIRFALLQGKTGRVRDPWMFVPERPWCETGARQAGRLLCGPRSHSRSNSHWMAICSRFYAVYHRKTVAMYASCYSCLNIRASSKNSSRHLEDIGR